MSEVNAYLSVRHFVPGQQHLSLTTFRRRLVHQLLRHPVTQRERGERMLLRGQELAANTNDHLLMKMPTTTGSTRAQRIRCRACGTKTYWYCSCGGAPIPGKRSALGFCNATQNPKCHADHREGKDVPDRMSLASKKGWVTKKREREEEGDEY